MANQLFDVTIDPSKIEKLNRLILQEKFFERINTLSKLNLSVTQKPTQGGVTIVDALTSADSVVEVIGGIEKVTLNLKNGQLFSQKVLFGGYDESKLQFNTLEGVINITSHVLIEVTDRDFLPVGYTTVYFYTRSSDLVSKSNYVRYSEDSEADANRDYAVDRNQLISSNVLNNSILFIDGPLIGGNLSSYSIDLIRVLHKKSVLPVFFVKNSGSNMVINNVLSLRNKFNSDLHWAYNFLQPGERSNFFLYRDRINQENTKIFCYIKPFNHTSPQRVEIHPYTYDLYSEYLGDTFDMIYYLIIVQGNKSNPQIRPIAIAEKYAREMIKTVNVQSLLRNSSLIATIDQERFGG